MRFPPLFPPGNKLYALYLVAVEPRPWSLLAILPPAREITRRLVIVGRKTRGCLGPGHERGERGDLGFEIGQLGFRVEELGFEIAGRHEDVHAIDNEG